MTTTITEPVAVVRFSSNKENMLDDVFLANSRTVTTPSELSFAFSALTNYLARSRALYPSPSAQKLWEKLFDGLSKLLDQRTRNGAPTRDKPYDGLNFSHEQVCNLSATFISKSLLQLCADNRLHKLSKVCLENNLSDAVLQIKYEAERTDAEKKVLGGLARFNDLRELYTAYKGFASNTAFSKTETPISEQLESLMKGAAHQFLSAKICLQLTDLTKSASTTKELAVKERRGRALVKTLNEYRTFVGRNFNPAEVEGLDAELFDKVTTPLLPKSTAVAAPQTSGRPASATM